MVMSLQLIGLPHSEMTGSRVICTSPVLIAAYHVLLRLREPRHPPVALSYFFFSYSAFDRHEHKAHGTKPVVLQN